MVIHRLNTHGIAIVLPSPPRMMIIYEKFSSFRLTTPPYSSSLTNQVFTTGNSSIYTLNATRFDDNVKYECEISNQALAKPLRLEQYLHVKCKHRRSM